MDFEYPSVDLDKAFIESTVSDEIESSLTDNFNMLNILGPKFDRSVKPKPAAFSKHADEIRHPFTYPSNNSEIKNFKEVPNEISGKSIPIVNRASKPMISSKSSVEKEDNIEVSKTDNLVQAMIDNKNKHLDALLSLEKQQ